MCSHYVIFKRCFPRENRHAMLLLRQRAWKKFPKKVRHTYLNAVREQYLNISILTKHLPRVTACTHCDLQVTLTDLGRCTSSQAWSIPNKCNKSTTLRSGPDLSVIDAVLNTRCRSPRGSLRCYRTQLGTHSAKHFLMTHGFYMEYL